MFHRHSKLTGVAVTITVLCLVFFSCKKEPEPTAIISVKISGNAVTFTVEATGAESFNWDFGDGSDGSIEQNPVHIYSEYGREYTVNLTVKGPGGTILVTTSVSIASMTVMEMLTGGENDTDGRTWKPDREAEVFIASPDAALSVNQKLAPAIMETWGFSSFYSDKYVFRYDGTFSILPAGNGIAAGLMYCKSKNIANTPPSQAAVEKGLTMIDSFKASSGLTFAYNESKDLSLQVCTDGENVTNVTIPDATTLSFSKDAFLAIKDWNNEYVILNMTNKTMKAAIFISTVPADSPQKGKPSFAFILTFRLVE